jgi:hypothetical protein
MIRILQLGRNGFELRLEHHPARNTNRSGTVPDKLIPRTDQIDETGADFRRRYEGEVYEVPILGELQNIVCHPENAHK